MTRHVLIVDDVMSAGTAARESIALIRAAGATAHAVAIALDRQEIRPRPAHFSELLGPGFALAFCAVALVFHLLVFRFFGLNRFVWAWVATFPAILYCAERL